MPKKRLILLLDSYPYNYGEYPFLKNELPLLTERYDVSILCRYPGEAQEETVDPKIRVYHTVPKFDLAAKLETAAAMLFTKAGRRELSEIIKSKGNYAVKLYESLSYLGCAREIRKYAKKELLSDPEEELLVYSFWFNSSCLAFLQEKRHFPKMKVVSRIHGYDLYRERTAAGRQPFRSYMKESVDRIFFIARNGMQYFADTWNQGECDSKYRFAPLGTVPGPKREADGTEGKNRDDFLLVSCANCIPLKRIELIGEALALLTKEELTGGSIRWVHFGDGDLLDELKRQADEINRSDGPVTARMEGFVLSEEILAYYGEQMPDGFITTSSTEGCPVSIQEAMCYGIPIIGTAVGEIPQMIDKNGTLLSADPAADEVKEAILKLYLDSQDPKKRRMMHDRSFELWQQTYDARKNGLLFCEELERLFS